jgi:two-component system phosphate regulon sensor histidine kinase PhoR
VAGQVADMLAPLAAEHGVTVVRSIRNGPALVRGDRDELVQVVANLVENGVKYGRAGGRVEIALDRDQDAEGPPGFTLAVSDDGPGIAPEHLPRLTERFYRVESDMGRQQKGTGLGLAIVKHIVSRHRGRLVIRSKVGEGSVFSVWLEAAEASPTPQGSAETSDLTAT